MEELLDFYDDDKFEIDIKPSYRKFYSADSSYGIYTATVTDDSPNQDKLKYISDFYREITLVGSMPELEFNKIYRAIVTPIDHKKYGLQYEASTIYEKLYTTRDEQIMFLGTVLTKNQVESITKAYPLEDDLIRLIKEDRIDLDLLHGIGEKTIEKIKIRIEQSEKYQKAIIRLTGKFGIPYNAVKRLSDKYGSPDILLQRIEEDPYILTEVDGFGFKTVDEIALSMGVKKDSPNRIGSCIEYILDDNANSGHCWIKETKLITDAIKLLGLKITDIRNFLKDHAGKDYEIEVKDGRVYLEKYLYYEKEIYNNLVRLLNSEIDYTVKDIESKIKEVEEKQGFEFTEEQRKAIYHAIENNIVVVTGKAGTGKTSVIKGIVEVLKSIEGLEYATCALSGKASQRIQESTGLSSYTIHRLLGFNPTMGFTFDHENKLGQDIIILDEASMVNSQLFYYLIRAIKDGAKLIITGDQAQLEPIGVGNTLIDMLDSEALPSVELTIVHRQAQKSGILSCANQVRDGIKFISEKDYSNKRLGELKDLYIYQSQDKETPYKTILAICKKYNGDVMDFQVLVPMKNRGSMSTKNLNNEIQKIFNKDPKEVDEVRKIERKDHTFLEGDKVIINGNNYDKDIFNGTMGVIEYIDSKAEKGEIVINFEGNGRINFTKEELNQIDLAYAITVHKSQGSQWKYVVFAIDYASYILLNRQLTYTGMTRAEEALFMPVESKALAHAIKTDNSVKRNTFLFDFLKEMPNKVA